MIKPDDLGGFYLIDLLNTIDVEKVISATYDLYLQRLEKDGISLEGAHIKLVPAYSKKGVRRWYFECPLTGKRCRKLFKHPATGEIGSREALGLRYRKQAKKGMPEGLEQL